MMRFTICRLPGPRVTAQVTARDGEAQTQYQGVTSVLIEVDAPRRSRRITLRTGAETPLVFEGDFTWGLDPPGVGEAGLLLLSAYDSRGGK